MVNFLKLTWIVWFLMFNLLNNFKLCLKFFIDNVFGNIFLLESYNLDSLFFDQVFLVGDYIKVQELSFLPEYFLITGLFCLTLFFLFSDQFTSNFEKVSVKFQYNHQLIFLLSLILTCYLAAVTQQLKISSLVLTSFNDTINNDLLAFSSKCVISVISLLYLIFINNYVKSQKLSNFEYFIILFVSIFGFLLLCCVNDFITAYLAIELQGLAFYLLASFKKSSNFSVESGVKYFVLGSLSTALLLLGITLVYGLSGSIVFSDFQDLFIWIFVTNSLFFTFDTVFLGFDFFQEKLVLSSNLEQSKLMTICENSELSFLNFEYENVFQNSSIKLLYILQESLLNYEKFMQLKVCLFESNYYDGTGLEKIYEFLNNQFVINCIVGESSLNGVYNFFNYCPSFIFINSGFINILPVLSLSDLIHLKLQNFLDHQCCGFALVEFFNSSFTISNSELDFSFLIIGFIIVVLALFFKLALAPFHLWSPDVYEGSPTSSTVFFMVLSKFGIFILLFRLCYFSFYNFISYWQTYSLFIASISILVGAVAGLKQRKLKSLLTYSSINNMGFVLLAFSSGNFEGIQASFYYLIVYILASLCMWSIILNLNLKITLHTDKQNRDLGDLALLQESNRITAQGLGLTLFSMAGLPPTVGFLAKLGVFKILSGFSVYYISTVNILFSIIATFYYLRIVKIIFFENFLIGNLYAAVNLKSIFITNLLTFLLVYFFFNPVFLYLYSYKITLFFKGSFF